MLTQQAIHAKLDSIEAYAEGLIIEVQRLKKEMGKVPEARKRGKGLSQEELSRASARFRQKLLLKCSKSS